LGIYLYLYRVELNGGYSKIKRIIRKDKLNNVA
jgi:hypothetical protein